MSVSVIFLLETEKISFDQYILLMKGTMPNAGFTQYSTVSTISALFEPRGSIFQNGFLGGVQFQFGSDLTNF